MKWLTSISDNIKRRKDRIKKLAQSEYGRTFGWLIEFDGVVLGELVEYKNSDMFWDSYLIVPKDDTSAEMLFDSNFWDENFNNKIKLKNKVILEYAHNNWYHSSKIDENRIVLRGLYLSSNNFVENILGGIYYQLYLKQKYVPRTKFSSTKFEKIRISINPNRAKRTRQIINLNNEGLVYINEFEEVVGRTHRTYSIKPEAVQKIQSLLNEANIFEIDEKLLKQWTWVKPFSIARSYSISIKNEIDDEDKYLSVSGVNFTEQGENLIKLIDTIEKLIGSGNPEKSLLE